MIVSAILSVVEVYSGMHISALLGYPDAWLQDKQADYKRMLKSLKTKRDEETQAQKASAENAKKEQAAEEVAYVSDRDSTTRVLPEGASRTLAFSEPSD